MARRNFPGETQGTLEEWLKDVNEEIATGKVNTEFGAGDTNFKAVQDSKLSPERRRDLILYDLTLLNPVKYPPGDVLPIRVTVGRMVEN